MANPERKLRPGQIDNKMRELRNEDIQEDGVDVMNSRMSKQVFGKNVWRGEKTNEFPYHRRGPNRH